MKKVAIYTIQSNNYGNRLQNFAVQKVISDLGFQPFTILTETKEERIEAFAKTHKKLPHKKHLVYSCLKARELLTVILDTRSGKFLKFNRNIKYSKDYITPIRISKGIESKYDYFIVGSDQVWNPEFQFVGLNSFLPFNHDNKIALSASFGIDNIDFDSETIDCLKAFKSISMREDSGAAIICERTNKEAIVLIDPTMMLSSDEWKEVMRKPKNISSEKFVLAYFLSQKSEEAEEQLRKIEGYKVYEFFKDEETKKYGPQEFLWMIANANLILTDSFHACVFSFIFDKPFLVFDRNNSGSSMNSRIDTLLRKFHLERKYFGSGIENNIWEHDYSQSYQTLMEEKQLFRNFLIDNLDI